MSKRKHKKRNKHTAEALARNKQYSKAADQKFCGEAPAEQGLSQMHVQHSKTLHMRCPNPLQPREPLSRFLRDELEKKVMEYLGKLCGQRGASVDTAYWKIITRKILSAGVGNSTMVVPARAGSGKSTWILAFLLALCDMYLNELDTAESLGGVMLVLQKVETLNDVVHEIKRFFPRNADDVITVLQSWNPSGVKRGFCQNRSAQSFEDCKRERCEYASTCKILAFQRRAPSAFIIGMTQSRFVKLRSSETGIEPYMVRMRGATAVNRRFLIFDEKFEMANTKTLSLRDINDASNEIESKGQSCNKSDRQIRNFQTGLSRHVTHAYNQLRRQTVYEGYGPVRDKPFGLISLKNQPNTEMDAFQKFWDASYRYDRSLVGNSMMRCLAIVRELYQNECLFCKNGGFHLLHVDEVKTVYGEAQTIIFDATARADGDYLYLQDVEFLDESPALHMKKTTFHIFTHQAMNVSRSAMKKQWKVPGLVALIDEILESYPEKTFLCTYLDLAEYLPQQIAADRMQFLSLMSDRDIPTVPYFGGTNGSNQFNDCTNVILLGYPRLDPQTYFFNTYAAWRKHGFTEQIQAVSEQLEMDESDALNALHRLPMLKQYESMHLAARLEQEIYRCALRNAQCDDIHVFLFAPPPEAWRLLKKRFPGCRVETIDGLPGCIEYQRSIAKSYGGQPTAFSKIAAFLQTWDGTPIKSKDLREQLDITGAAWKDVLQEDKMCALLIEHGVSRVGRGANATWRRAEWSQSA